MRERVTTGAPGTSKGRQRLLGSRVKRMHMMVLLCKKPGLSCPKTGVIVPQIFSTLALTLVFTMTFTVFTPLCTL